MRYSLQEEYVPTRGRDSLRTAADQLIDRLYGTRRAAPHWPYVYPADVTPGREAYACRVRFGGAVLAPALEIGDLPPELVSLSIAVMNRLNAGTGVFILNFQRYRSGNAHILPHFDGEYFRWRKLSDGQMRVDHGLRPRHCALLCLENRAPDSATTLVDDRAERLNFNLRAGDLFIFDNQYYAHCVEPFYWNPEEGRDWVRYMIGWRSITIECNEIKGSTETPVSPIYADRLIAARGAPAWTEAPF